MARFAGSVMIGDLDDYITPSQSCVNPLLTAADDAADGGKGGGKGGGGARDAGAAKISLDSGVLSGVPAEPDLIRGGGGGAGGGGATASVTLADCLACSGCVTSTESLLIQEQSGDEFLSQVRGGKYKRVVVSLAPQSIASFAVEWGVDTGAAYRRLSAFFKAQGVHYVVDTCSASDLALIETAEEFLYRYKNQVKAAWEVPEPTLAVSRQSVIKRPSDDSGVLPSVAVAKAEAGGEEAPAKCEAESQYNLLPMLSSACPGFVCFAEKMQPEALPYISTTKSPQQIIGSLLKHVINTGSEGELSPADVYHVTVMPCFDKKLEATRRDFVDEVSKRREVDCVLTTSEVQEMIAAQKHDVTLTDDADVEAESPEQYFRTLDPTASKLSVSVTDTAGSGGFLDFVFRAAALSLFGMVVAPGPLPFKKGRNPDLQEVALEVDGKKVLRFCKAYGFRNIQTVINKMKRGRCPYSFVEIMACPSGCVNGGGQIQADGATSAEGAPVGRAAAAKSKEHIGLVSDAYHGGRVGREVMAGPAVKAVYTDKLKCEPFSETSRDLMHTRYHTVPKLPGNAFAIKW